MLKNILENMFNNAMNLNKKNILDLLEFNKNSVILDLGCNDGAWTCELKKKIGTEYAHGVEIVESSAEEAKKKGIDVRIANLDKDVIPFENNFFDVVHSNQVIEHVSNLDFFMSETYRVLKPGGYVVISTENGSSWHNIFASLFGWQIFSLTNISLIHSGIGNPMALHRNSQDTRTAWTHKTIFNIRGLKEYLLANKFKNVKCKGAGYYPFPCNLGNIDSIHSHFMVFKAWK